MPRKHQNSKDELSFKDYVFVNLNLSVADRPKFTVWMDEIEADMPLILDELIVQNHKISLAWSDYHDSFTASITCRDPESENFGKIMTANARTSTEALFVALYKVLVICDSGVWTVTAQDGSWG